MSKPIDSSSKVVTHDALSTDKKKQSSFLQNVVVGSLSGLSAVTIIQPMIFFKNKNQEKAIQAKSVSQVRGFEKNPLVWYRGVGAFAASFAPSIALQTGVNGVVSKVCDPLLAASVAGVLSAFVVCPTDVVMNQQQKTGKSLIQTARHVSSSHGLSGFYRAFVPTAVREGLFTAAYLGATPLMKEKICSLGVNEWVSQVVAGTTAGIAAAAISHPFDTIKTQKQRDFSITTSTVKGIFQKTAFAGFGWRISSVVTATTVMPFVQEKLNAKIGNAKG